LNMAKIRMSVATAQRQKNAAQIIAKVQR